MRILFIFIDGIGLGDANPATNPLVRFAASFFLKNFSAPLTRELGHFATKHISLIPLDAKLGVAGLPQSATGQTTLFTGINAARIMGRHIQAFPGPQLVNVIAEHGIMKRICALGRKATSANMYTPNYLELVRQRKRRHSVTTRLILEAGLPLRSLPELAQRCAVYQDITNEMLPLFGWDGIPVIKPAEAARRLLTIAQEHDFTLFEYFQTDRCGHKQNWERAETIIHDLNELLETIQYSLPEDMVTMVCSDHGNFEDLSTKTHTLNPIPLILFGCGSQQLAGSIRQMTDVTPAILNSLRELKQSD
ncbi:MAG: metalloenzyme [Negativicutes bacterium]|nr:metalloenzyme [Negativicutes bacterium]